MINHTDFISSFFQIRLLSIASLATRSKLIKYSDLQKELRLDGIRELEDLIIEGTNCNVMRGKLDQKSSHFEVDWAMGRDIKKVCVFVNNYKILRVT